MIPTELSNKNRYVVIDGQEVDLVELPEFIRNVIQAITTVKAHGYGSISISFHNSKGSMEMSLKQLFDC